MPLLWNRKKCFIIFTLKNTTKITFKGILGLAALSCKFIYIITSSSLCYYLPKRKHWQDSMPSPKYHESNLIKPLHSHLNIDRLFAKASLSCKTNTVDCHSSVSM